VNVAGTELSPQQLYDILRLRVDVFVVEQNCPYPELDGLDLLPGTRHLWLGEVDAYLRVLSREDGTYQVGRVVTAKHARGQGFAAQLMREALELVGDTDSVLHAQTYAQGFYVKFGYLPEGAEFDEDGIPHITMWRRVAPPR
jgi:ElaA protein